MYSTPNTYVVIFCFLFSLNTHTCSKDDGFRLIYCPDISASQQVRTEASADRCVYFCLFFLLFCLFSELLTSIEAYQCSQDLREAMCIGYKKQAHFLHSIMFKRIYWKRPPSQIPDFQPFPNQVPLQ